MWHILNHWLKHKEYRPSYTGRKRINQGTHNVQSFLDTSKENYAASRGLEEHHVANKLWNSPFNSFFL